MHTNDSQTTEELWNNGSLNAFYWYQIFALDSAVVEVQEMFSSHGGFLNNNSSVASIYFEILRKN